MPLTFCNHTAPLDRVSSAPPCIANTRCRHCLYNRLPLQSRYNFLHKSHCAGQNRRRRPVCAYSKYDQGTTNPQPRYNSPIPTNLRSAVHSVSFNQQVLCNMSDYASGNVVLEQTLKGTVGVCPAAFDSALHTSSCTWRAVCPQPSSVLHCTAFGCILHTRLARGGQAPAGSLVAAYTGWLAAFPQF